MLTEKAYDHPTFNSFIASYDFIDLSHIPSNSLFQAEVLWSARNLQLPKSRGIIQTPNVISIHEVRNAQCYCRVIKSNVSVSLSCNQCSLI